jgi:hypothetical protein
MDIADLLFICVVGILAILSTVAIFVWRGILWLAFISGVMWMLLGFFFMTRTQGGTELLAFQEYLQLLFVGIGVAMFFSPMWLRAKQMDIERNAPNDIKIWGKDENFNEDLREFGINSEVKKKKNE